MWGGGWIVPGVESIHVSLQEPSMRNILKGGRDRGGSVNKMRLDFSIPFFQWTFRAGNLLSRVSSYPVACYFGRGFMIIKDIFASQTRTYFSPE